MDNNTYIEMMVNTNDDIIVDTSAVMDSDWLRQFSERAEPIFKAAGKHITVPPAVRSELLRHLDSVDDEKRTKAEKAVSILADYKNLFQASGGMLDDDDVAKAFADKELLILLMMNRSGRRQLLIANDRSLTRDAYDLNKLESCQGGRISVCHIDRFGQLQRCSCVTETRQRQDPSGEFNSFDVEPCFDNMRVWDSMTREGEEISSDERTILAPEKDEQKPPEQIDTDSAKSTTGVQAKAESEKPGQKKRDWWKWLLAFTGGVATGVFGSKIAQSYVCPFAAV